MTALRPHRNLAGLLSVLGRPLPETVRAAPSPPPDTDLGDVLRRVAASGHPPESASAVAQLWRGLGARDRAQLARPLAPAADGHLRLGARRAVQTSTTTCGSAVLVMLLAAGDPVVAAWLLTGRRLGSLPKEIAGVAGTAAADGDAEDAPMRRFSAAQEAMQRATSRHGLGLLSWPSALGTPPWTAARHARFPGVGYGHRAVDDTDAAEMERVLAWVRSSAHRGIPVPLYTGGDLATGVRLAVPRHVVLVVPAPAGPRAGVLAIYEPTRGRVHEILESELVARTQPHAALGEWTHVCWAVLPHAVRPPGTQRRTLR